MYSSPAGSPPSAGRVCVGSGSSSGKGTSIARIRAELGALFDGHVGCIAFQQDDQHLDVMDWVYKVSKLETKQGMACSLKASDWSFIHAARS